MKISVQLVIEPEDGQPVTAKPIAQLKCADLTVDTLGLTLAESKSILGNLQTELAQYQVTDYIDEQRICPQCDRPQSIKGHHTIVYRTLFGKLCLKSPRLYVCSCQDSDSKSISPLTRC